MARRIPRTPAEPLDIGLFVAIVVSLGLLAGNPTATYEVAIDQPPPAVASAVLLPVFALSPLLAAAVLVHRLGLAGGIRAFLRERLRVRTDLRWYLVAIGSMPALFVVASLGFVALDRPVAVDPTILGPLVLEVVALGIVFNLVENYGWRGFLQEALQSRVSALVATLAVGVVWGLWHASLFLPGGSFEAFPPAAFLLVVVGESVVIGWLYNSTGGSVLHATLMHTSFNASFGTFLATMVMAGRSVDAFYWLTAVLIWSAVAVIVYRTDASTLCGSAGVASSG